MTTNDNAEEQDSTFNRAKDNKHEAMRKMLSEDIHDSPEDEEKMKGETVILDLPDVSDIPGQEHITVPVIGEMIDTTISSDDEEGVGLFGDDEADEDMDLEMSDETDVSKTEKNLLQKAETDMLSEDDAALRSSELDSTDNDGDELNEGGPATDIGGGDLDVPGAAADDRMEAIGEEDEENNEYSLGSASNDDVTEGTP